ncbi:ribonuclease P protein subunit p38 [Rana temporaria]|uniref:ribonuclease P protein subunit p38 n=1 Tax=Rana temporaria TaxID=8407 RepID=UPI001AAC81F6|nr:ribonuclease P protein subunit p38 [Rana temporaria]XP_040208362.1 ribonuclease P protein subunit p38 [Rana temporaria]XP_040208363.1 ribonuclease P protein subunit p38 [Rana temporaria]
MAAKVAKGSIRKSKPIVVKTSLNNPYEKMWTPVVGEDMQFILKTLTEKFTQVGLKKVEIHKKFIKKNKGSKKENPDGTDKNPDLGGERSDRENAEEEPVKSGWTLSDVRKHLVIGINEVTRALEKNELHLVIVCKSAKPQMITQHITELSASRGVTACQLPRLSENVAPVLGLKSVLALGFKKTSDMFLEEVEAIVPRVPPLKVSWLTRKPRRTKENAVDDKGTGNENENSPTSRKRKSPKAEEDGSVQLQSLKVKKIVPNPNKKRKIKVKKNANKK